MRLTRNQQAVLNDLRDIGRKNFQRYQESSIFLHNRDRERIAKGDQACTHGMGGLSYQVAHRLNMKAGAVLSIFKALEKKGLVVRESIDPSYKRPLYWWPVGLAEELRQVQP